jgi:hypothetical protein
VTKLGWLQVLEAGGAGAEPDGELLAGELLLWEADGLGLALLLADAPALGCGLVFGMRAMTGA